MSESVLAIIVCYNPDIAALKRSLTAIFKQKCDSVIIDNASNNRADIQSLIGELQHDQVLPKVQIELVEQSSNLGVGVAHNVGISYARQRNYSHVLILDQDSVPLEGMIENLLSAHIHKSESHNVSAVGATYLNADNGSESFFVRFGRLKFQRHYCAERDSQGCIEADFLISSGSLFALNTLADIGVMDERLFIDHVDTEWFLRARSKGFKAFGVCNAVMQHGLGEQTHRISLGRRQRNVPQHKSFRYYYIFRNSVLLYKRGYVSGLWKWNDVQRLAMIMLVFGFYKAPRVENLRAMIKGIRDGLQGVSGSIDV